MVIGNELTGGYHLQIELDANNKVTTVPKNLIRVEGAPAMGGAGGPGPQPRTGFGGGGPPAAGSQGGFGFRSSQQSQGQYAGSYGTRTPMHPSMTPMHHFGSGGGQATPSHPGAMTPMHAPYTPMHAPTPMDDNYHSGGGGGRAGGGGGMGGGRGMHGDARGGSMNAPTPGMHGMAYTPSGYTPALTPGAYGTAPTPGGMGDLHGENREACFQERSYMLYCTGLP